MTTEQMVKALTDVGAIFAVSTAKYVGANDPMGSKPSYHIHPNAEYPHEKHIVRVWSQAQFLDWVRTMKAAQRCADQADAYDLMQAYELRWDK